MFKQKLFEIYLSLSHNISIYDILSMIVCCLYFLSFFFFFLFPRKEKRDNNSVCVCGKKTKIMVWDVRKIHNK